jgi:hypothetical protein
MISLTKGYVTMSDIQSTQMNDANFRWSDEEICDYFDTHPNVLLSELASMSGWSLAYIKRTLMGDDVHE